MIAFIFLSICLLGVMLSSISIPKSYDYEKVVIVSAQKNLIDGEVTVCGEDYFYTLSKNKVENSLQSLNSSNVKGIVYYFSKDKGLNYFKNDLSLTLTDKTYVCDRQVYYGYDKSYYQYRLIDGKKINFQLVCDGENWLLGYPMILTGF